MSRTKQLCSVIAFGSFALAAAAGFARADDAAAPIDRAPNAVKKEEMVATSLPAAVSDALTPKYPKAQDKSGGEIGMPDSLFRGIPDFMKRAGAKPFLKLMKESTGIDGSVSFEPSAAALGKKLKDGTVQLAVFHGHEFACECAKNSDLVPIAVTDPMQPIQAFCLVAWNRDARSMADLQNETLTLPPVEHDYCKLFLEKRMAGKKFAKQLKADSTNDAIFDVIEGKAACTVVDGSALKCFQRVNPGAAKSIKILCQSEVFPNACVAFCNGKLSQSTVDKFQKALLEAANSQQGKRMLGDWKLKGFVVVPEDYEKQLKVVRETYSVR